MEEHVNPEEKENKRISAIVSGVVMALMLIFIFWPLLKMPGQTEQTSGILIAFGAADGARVEAAEAAASADAASSSAEDTAADTGEDASATADTPDEVATDDSDEAAIAKKKAEADKKKKAEEKKKAEADRKAKEKADREAKEKAEREAKAKAEREKKEALDKAKNSLSDFLGGGDGGDSPKGDPDGDPDASNLEGISTGVGDIGAGLGGREIVKRPSPIKDNSQKTGKVVVKVCVGSNGKVISAKYTQQGSTTNDPTLISKSEKKAREYVFSSGERDKQCGNITFKFDVR